MRSTSTCSCRGIGSVLAIRRGVVRRQRLGLTLLAVHATVYGVVVLTVLPPLLAVLFVVVHQGLFGVYLGCVFAPNHKGMPTWAKGTKLTFLERQVIGSRNILPGRIAEFMFGGLNYQIEHHLFPTMARANLGAAHDIVRPFCLQQGIPYEEVSVWESYRQTFAALDRCGKATRTS